MNKFNNEQLSAIRHTDGAALIIAGPGSGKTTVMTNRIAYLIKNCGVQPGNILAVTFTRAGAQILKYLSQSGRRSLRNISLGVFGNT